MAAAATTPGFSLHFSPSASPPEDQLCSEPKPSQNSEHSSPEWRPLCSPPRHASVPNCSSSAIIQVFVPCHSVEGIKQSEDNDKPDTEGQMTPSL